MKLQDRLRNTLMKNNVFKLSNAKNILIIAFFVLIVITSIIGSIIHENKLKNDEIKSQNEISLNQSIDRQKSEQITKEYMLACSNYNSAIDSYNHEAERINSLIRKISVYHLYDQEINLPHKSYINKDFSNIPVEESKITSIVSETEDINNKCEILKSQYNDVCKNAYASLLNQYEVVADAYNSLLNKTACDYIRDIPTSVEQIEIEIPTSISNNYDEIKYIESLDNIYKHIKEIAPYCTLLEQITAPDQKWVEERLNEVKSITGYMGVSKNNDPNNLLDKKGGYSSCLYFTSKYIDPKTIEGSDIVAKGTDAGGAIEIYPDLESAKARCEYLSQFDNTLLYSGSYVIVGTMVVRTSYKLSDKEQVNMTDDIIKALTMLRYE